MGGGVRRAGRACLYGRDPFNHNSNRTDREKRTTSKGGPVFSKLFRLDRTDPLSFGPKFPESLVEWIAPYVYRSDLSGSHTFSCAILMCYGNSENSDGYHIFSGFALFTKLTFVYRRIESLCKLLTANKVPLDLPTNKCKSNYRPS